jgi:hypothetical protein
MLPSNAPIAPRPAITALGRFRYPVVVGGGTPFLPQVTEDVPLDLVETRTFGSRVIYERDRRVRDDGAAVSLMSLSQ